MAQLETLLLQTTHGRLEALLRQPDVADGLPAGSYTPAMVAVVCHPHPLGGGTMHNKVVFRIAQALGDVGMPTLRFNFRGVGRSTGRFDAGRGESDDVCTALDAVAERYPRVPICLAGFSFGAWVGLPVGATDPRVGRLVGVGVPVGSLKVDQLADCHVPKLIVQGACDEYGPLAVLQDWFDALLDPKRLVVVPGADHFFTQQQDELRAAVRQGMNM